MDWQPDPATLRQLAGCLSDSLQGTNREVQTQATEMLQQAKSSPDISNYLAYLVSVQQEPSNLGVGPASYPQVRESAAVMLKNFVASSYQFIPPEKLTYVRSLAILGLQDANSRVRNTSGNVVTELVRRGGILDWPQLLPELLSLAANEGGQVSTESQEGAMSALYKVCEDNKKLLDHDYSGQRPLDIIFPKLIDLCQSAIPRVRADAINSLNVFLTSRPQILDVSIEPLLNTLFRLAPDGNNDVRKNVCRAFTLLVDVRPDVIAPHMSGLVDYIITQQTDEEDSELALEAAEFWLVVGEHNKLKTTLGPYLERIVPVLLRGMVYSDDNVMMLEDAEEDADAEDKAEDIKPTFAKGKAARTAGGTSNGVEPPESTHTPETNDQEQEEDGLSEGEIEDSEFEYGDPEEQWNLRKCSAATLDVLASIFHAPVFTYTLPYLKENLRHEKWPRREAAVLALGAVADGCMDAVTPDLPELIPYLISLLNDKQAVVRQITCWTLGRYSAWAAFLPDEAERARFFEPMLEGLLTKMLDSTKRVQEAGASAFVSLEEKADQMLMPYIQPVVQQFVRCFERYKDRNMVILYDCVQTLAEIAGEKLAEESLVNMLMPALIQRWNKISDQSREMVVLLECMSYVSAALGPAVTQFVGPLFTRCIRIIHQNLQESVAAAQNPALDIPDKDFLVTSLDLLSSIIQVVDSQTSSQLVASSEPKFFELLGYCLEDTTNDVRQSSFALLGDCSIFVYGQLEAYIPRFMRVLIGQLDVDSGLDDHIHTGFSVVNNACWSCGEICYKQREGILPYFDELYPRLRGIILNPEIPESLGENAAIALGRLGIGAYEPMASQLGDVAEAFLDAMERADWNGEKDSAFEGFTQLVLRNPAALEKCLPKYFEAIARSTAAARAPHLQASSKPLHALFANAVKGYKSMIPDWEAFLSRLRPEDRQIIQQY